MPTPAANLFYDFWRKIDAALSGRNNNISVPDTAAYLNEAQRVWFTGRVRLTETSPEVTDDLRAFKLDEIPLSLRFKSGGKIVAKYPPNLFKRLNQYVVATCNQCPGITKEFPISIVQTDDIHSTRLSNYGKADFPYEQLPAQVTSNGLLLHVDGAFTVNSVLISYYRVPNEIHAPSLLDCEGCDCYYLPTGEKISEDSDFEVGETFAADAVVDIAVLYALRDQGEVTDFQTQLNKILTKN